MDSSEDPWGPGREVAGGGKMSMRRRRRGIRMGKRGHEAGGRRQEDGEGR